MGEKSQYPRDYNPPFRGVCVICGYETRGATKDWLERCPEHWQALDPHRRMSEALKRAK